MKLQSHLGQFNIAIDVIQQVKNVGHIKPQGGLWTSDVTESSSEWIEWCIAEDFCDPPYVHQIFEVLDTAKILKIDYKQQLNILPHSSGVFVLCLDYEAIVAEGYDAIHINCYISGFDICSTVWFNANHLKFIETRTVKGGY